jgi:catechol 2,3-dioxygenase-like lactoylglutathione lyase family enzyme
MGTQGELLSPRMRIRQSCNPTYMYRAGRRVGAARPGRRFEGWTGVVDGQHKRDHGPTGGWRREVAVSGTCYGCEERGGDMHAQRILETCLYVDNLDAAEVFYQRVLGLEVTSRVTGRHVFFRCGDSMFLLFDPQATRRPTGEVPTHGALGPGHVAFATTPEDVAAWREHLQRHGVAVEAEIDWPSGGRSLYFRDPAGNSVEVTTPATWPPLMRHQEAP